MNHLKNIYIIIFILALVGCTSQYGKISPQDPIVAPVTIQVLAADWDRFYVYSGSRDGVRAEGLIFDPKDNTTRITSDTWIPIEDKASFDKVLNQVHVIVPNARVARILAPDNREFGFIFYRTTLHVPVRLVDADTLYVMRMPMPVSTR